MRGNGLMKVCRLGVFLGCYLIATASWWLWRLRNEILFQNKVTSVNEIFYKVVALVLAYEMAKQPDGWVKLNCDGSYKKMELGDRDPCPSSPWLGSPGDRFRLKATTEKG
ncbi:hypothetical protein BHE74_00000814 [Ensete ventricosum]|nr:hypothetical protein BHE74_00000814 [Ensete ventricosum]